MLELLREFHRDKLGLRQRHVAAARHVRDYQINNAYQYVIAREDAQVGWLHDAVTDMGGRPDDVPEPEIKAPGKAPRGKSPFSPSTAISRGRPSKSGVRESRSCQTPDTGRCCR